jgi:hypothetical protein
MPAGFMLSRHGDFAVREGGRLGPLLADYVFYAMAIGGLIFFVTARRSHPSLTGAGIHQD